MNTSKHSNPDIKWHYTLEDIPKNGSQIIAEFPSDDGNHKYRVVRWSTPGYDDRGNWVDDEYNYYKETIIRWAST